MSKHKYHEVIKAWANGEIILGKHRLSTLWNEFNNSQVVNFNCPDWEWKLKPKTKFGYMNIYQTGSHLDCGGYIYPTMEEAIFYGQNKTIIDTIRVEYENKCSRKETS